MYSKHITELLYGIWSVDKEIAEFYLSSLIHPSDLLSMDYSQERAENRPVLFSRSQDRIVESEFSADESVPDKSVAVVKINGVISKYDKTCGPEGVESHLKRISSFAGNPNVSCIVLKINSPGGESNAANFMAGELLSLRDQKPIIAFVEDLCCSAAYWIASSCNSIGVSTELSVVGSIGTFTTIKNYQKKFEKEGINIVDLYATASTQKNIEYREALQGNFEKLQKDLDFYNEHFINTVVKNRPVLRENQEWKTGKKFYANEALKSGLIDFMAPFNDLIENILI